jgi:hypothetical protein
VSIDYANGFDDGFAKDDWYWKGFDDSYDTLTKTPISYQGGDIPFVETPYYDRGYYDGIWYAYNDGYFVSYDDAFAIGFSEGYDAAFFSGYLTFLQEDQHIEYDNGGWGDGYNDGFSEGRVFGASDYEQGLTLDWIDALLDYRSGTDLYFKEIGVGTGSYGPVVLYVYGTDPAVWKSDCFARDFGKAPRMTVRGGAQADAAKSAKSMYRAMTDEVRAELNKHPSTTARSGRTITLTTTWLERIEAYRDTQNSGAKSLRLRAADGK